MWRPPAVLLLVALPLLGPPAARAWTPGTQQTIAREAAAIAPPDLARQIAKHERSYREGVIAPFRDAPAERHYRHKEGEGQLDAATFEAVEAAIEAIRALRPFEEVVFRLGVVSHFVADANQPLSTADDDPRETSYFADWSRYAASAEPRFALVLYAAGDEPSTDREMRLLVYRSLARARELYPLVGMEYARIGFGSGVAAFDDRSTAFGVAAVSFSHAVTDVARIFRYIWLRAGGIDPRTELWGHDGLVQLPRAAREPRS